MKESHSYYLKESNKSCPGNVFVSNVIDLDLFLTRPCSYLTNNKVFQVGWRLCYLTTASFSGGLRC